MRHPLRSGTSLLRSLFVFGPSIVLGIGLSGCARRIDFTPSELERVQSEVGVNPVRVYPSHKVIARYVTGVKDEGFGAKQGVLHESTRRDEVSIETGKNTMGLIIAVDELNGQPLLWVTFAEWCKTPECSYGFVQTEDGHFRLIVVPEREGYQEPAVYRAQACKKHKMEKGKLESLAEANDVFVVKKSNGDLLTVDLQVKKKTASSGSRERQRNVGVGVDG